MARRLTVLVGTARPFEATRPFGAIREALGLRRGSSGPRRAALARPLGGEGEGRTAVPAADLRHRIVDEILDLVEVLSGATGVAVVPGGPALGRRLHPRTGPRSPPPCAAPPGTLCGRSSSFGRFEVLHVAAVLGDLFSLLDRAFKGMATSQEPFDRWFREYVRDVHGVDLEEDFPPPEQALDLSA